MSEESIRVSYLISTRNRAKYLAKTLHNVRAFIAPDDELIIADGASTDDTAQVAQANRDLIDLFLSEPDCGEAHGFNKAMLAARGRFIKFLTDDDHFFPEAMCQAISLLENSPDVDALLCGGECYAVDPASGQLRLRHYAFLHPGEELTNEVALINGRLGCGLGLLLRSKVIAQVGLLDSTYKMVDVDYLARLIAARINLRYAHLKIYRHILYAHSAANDVHQGLVDAARATLTCRRWDLSGMTDPASLGEALGLRSLPQGAALCELILHGERIRRSRLRCMLGVLATMLNLLYSFFATARKFTRQRGKQHSSCRPTQGIEREPEWSGALQ